MFMDNALCNMIQTFYDMFASSHEDYMEHHAIGNKRWSSNVSVFTTTQSVGQDNLRICYADMPYDIVV